jgi:predicted transcriptional regulator
MAMEITFTREIEETLRKIAADTGRGAEQVVVELVTTQLDHDAWFRHEVQKGISSLDRGEHVDHEEVGRRMEQALGS